MIFARTTWLDLTSELRQEIWPAGEPQNLVPAHDKAFIEAMVDLQQAVDCLQYNNTSIYPQCASLFQCGLTVLEAPYGNVRRVYTVDRINQTTGEEDASAPIDWCSKVHYDQTKFCHLEDYVSKTIACGTCGSGSVSLSSLFAWPRGLCNKNTFTPPTDVEWTGFDALPQGLHYAQASTDSNYGRSLRGVWALRRGRLYLAPWIQSTETVVVEWDGIKREWADEDLVDSDPLLKRALRFYAQSQHLRDYDNDFEKADRVWAEYQKARSELMYNCRELHRIRGCEESQALQSVAVTEMAVRGAGDSPLPNNDPANSGNQTTCPVVGPVVFDPPSGSVVVYPLTVVMTSSSEGASIYFTTDGSEPTAASTLYTEPVPLAEGYNLRARAILGGCWSDITNSDYTSFGDPDDNSFFRMCATGDQVGPWYVFSPNHSADHIFKLKLTLPDLTEIVRLELYRTNDAGVWNTGRCWATKYLIYPEERGGASFPSFPVGVFENNIQLNTTYLDTLGDFAAGAHEFTLYGETLGLDPSTYYKLLVVLGDGRTIHFFTGTSCSENGENPFFGDCGEATPTPAPTSGPTSTPSGGVECSSGCRSAYVISGGAFSSPVQVNSSNDFCTNFSGTTSYEGSPVTVYLIFQSGGGTDYWEISWDFGTLSSSDPVETACHADEATFSNGYNVT